MLHTFDVSLNKRTRFSFSYSLVINYLYTSVNFLQLSCSAAESPQLVKSFIYSFLSVELDSASLKNYLIKIYMFAMFLCFKRQPRLKSCFPYNKMCRRNLWLMSMILIFTKAFKRFCFFFMGKNIL